MLIELASFEALGTVSASAPKPSQLAHSGKTARKPNGYRVSGVLKMGHGGLDLIQKKAASSCGL
jgi:hypothetical protein